MTNISEAAKKIVRGLQRWEQALLDEHSGIRREPLLCVDANGEHDEDELGIYFDRVESEAELSALAHCRGRVLDVAATAGRHTLELQHRNFDVTALDLLPGCSRIMEERGVDQVACADALTFLSESRFESVLLLYDSVGIAGSLQGFEQLVSNLTGLLEPGGQVIVHSDKVPESERFEHGCFWGEESFSFSYRGITDPAFPWLCIDPVTLDERMPRFRQRILYENEEEYVAAMILDTNA